MKLIRDAKFLVSNTDPKKCPKPDLPEYAFIGRSNVGKSSLINLLTNKKNLAKTSGKPGKTRLINHFVIDGAWYLVDLPGYGWAQVSKSEKEKWEGMIKSYLLNRENLMCVFLLIDSRHEPQKPDREFMRWMGENGIPFVMVFTKADKQSINKTQSNIAAYKRDMMSEWEELPEIFITSSLSRTGREEILQFIEEVNQNNS